LFGLFHINPPSWLVGSGAHKDSLVGNFISGALATLLGTACTAPVLVTAVGFALTRQTQDIFLIFAVMGIGMSLPYLLLAARPKLANCLPKPGAWMVKVKYFMGVLLLGTALWLGYVLYEQIAEPQEMAEISGGQEWQVFDEAKIPTLIAEGKTVFVDVTAAWCVNCKANKLAVLDTEEITKFFADNNVVLLKGDMTRPSKPLLEYIKKYNRFGIPFNMVYGSNAKDGILLDSLLSKDAVKAAIEKAK
jgi:suppressor for copper-sensitivity B